MQLRRSLLISFIFITFSVNHLGARQLPVIIETSSAQDVQELISRGLKIHARSGDALMGMIPEEIVGNLEAKVEYLPATMNDFEGVYQVDKRALQRKPELRDRLQVLYEAEGWLLFEGVEEDLNALGSAGIHFRAIPGQGYSYYGTDACKEGLDIIEPFVGVIIDQVSSASYKGYIQSLQDFITRNTYNSECNDAAFWLLQQFQNIGLSAWMDTFEIGGLTRYNVIAEQTGSLHPNQMYYLTGHYDATAGLPVLPEDEAPGADDDGSGAAMVLECARVMSEFSFQNTIRYAVFAGNEQGLIGSAAYVAGLPQTGEVYLGVFCADMIGWSGSDPWPPDLVIYANDDPVSLILADKVSEAVATFLPGFLEPVILQDPTMVYADHAPFWDANIPAVLNMEDEAWGTDLNPYYHSDEDLLEHLDILYGVHVLEAVLGSVADLAVPDGSTDPFLTAGSVTLDDSQGNNNGQIEYGESVYLTIPVINAGGGDATSVDVVLSESDPYISFSDSLENYGDILSQDTVIVSNAFLADITTNVPDEHQFNVAVLMTSGANQWSSTVQMIAHAPDMVLDELNIDDSVGGNGNGILEPGETADIEITLINEGSFEAENLIVNLACETSNIVVNTFSQSYGTLMPGNVAMREFNVTVESTSPAYFLADFNLTYQAAGGWMTFDGFTLDVGDITYLPSGPDSYGYLAYDINDAPLAPVYNWIEIDPHIGGPGTELNFTGDDQTFHLTLPFTFVYYGSSFTEISVCSNGWIACGYTENTDYSNSGIPNEDGPPNMIAPFWEDLSPQAEGTVSYFYDSVEGIYIIEYNDVRDYQPSYHNMTFEVVLYDPAVHPTSTGDGNILFQYGNLDNTNSCTVGIENQAENDGIQYLYNLNYDVHATHVEDGMAILFTTGEDIPEFTVELTYLSGSPVPAGGGFITFDVYLANNETGSKNFDLWIEIPPQVIPPSVPNRNLTFPGGFSLTRPGMPWPIPASWPAGNYVMIWNIGILSSLNVWASDSFPFIKSAASNGINLPEWALDYDPLDQLFVNTGIDEPATVTEFALYGNYPNPFNPTTTISFALPEASHVQLAIFDIQGRKVEVIINGQRDAGNHEITWDASTLPSGIYFYSIQAADFKAVKKMVLIK